MNADCPLFSVEKRLLDCLNLIIETREEYFSPEKFRRCLNNTIQSLRTVTFVLQNQKSNFEGFDAWYTHWQDLMRNDEIMKWIKDARNNIEKQGDLETNSLVRASVVETWGRSNIFEMEVNPSDSNQEIVEKIRSKIPNKEDLIVGLLRIERRWVDSLLPGKEIIESLTHAFQGYRSLLIDAHKKLMRSEVTACCEFYKGFGASGEKKLPCFVAQDWDRSIWVDINNGDILNINYSHVTLNKKDAERVFAHYPDISDLLPKKDMIKTIENEAKTIFQQAKSVLQKDGYHQTIAILGYPDGRKTITSLFIMSRADKHLSFRQLAVDIEKTGADSLILITEAWTTDSHDYKLTKDGLEGSNVKNCLEVVATNKEGKIYSCVALFSKSKDGSITFEKESCGDSPMMNWLIPIFNAWKIPIATSEERSQKVKEYYRKLEPNSKAPCLCGSGLRFKRCCGNGKYSQGKGALDSAYRLFKQGHYKEALINCRLWITQYLIWHKAHTVPIQKNANRYSLHLIDIDVKAMSEGIDFLMSCYEKAGFHDQFPSVLSFLEDKINDKRWKHFLIYQKALWSLLPDWTPLAEEQARKEMRRIKDYGEVHDPLILQLHFELYRDTLRFPEKLEAIEKIIKNSIKPEEKLQYRSRKGVEYLLINDEKSAIDEIQSAVFEFEKTDLKELNFKQNLNIGETLLLFGRLKKDNDAIINARNKFIEAEKLAENDDKSKAIIYRYIGETFECQMNWKESFGFYEKSFNLNSDQLVQVFASKCLVNLGRLDDARNRLDAIDLMKLTSANKFDAAIAWAILAFESERKSDVSRAVELLEEQKPDSPYFLHVKESLIGDLLKPFASISLKENIYCQTSLIRGVKL